MRLTITLALLLASCAPQTRVLHPSIIERPTWKSLTDSSTKECAAPRCESYLVLVMGGPGLTDAEGWLCPKNGFTCTKQFGGQVWILERRRK